MDYYRLENKVPDRFAYTRGAIPNGPVSLYSTHFAVDPKTLEVHQSIETKTTPSRVYYSGFNNTEHAYDSGEQLPLFHTQEEPATFHVATAFGTERGRTHAMLLTSMAKARGEQVFGPINTITTPDDLSQHSLKVVKNAKERGLLSTSEYDIPDSPTNDINFARPEHGLQTIDQYYEYSADDTNRSTKIYPDKASTEEIKAGKTELRKFLGRPERPKRQPPVSTEQFEQLQLDGF